MNTDAGSTPAPTDSPCVLPAAIRHDLTNMYRLMTMAAHHDAEPVSLELLERVVVAAMNQGVVEAIEDHLALSDIDEPGADRILDRLNHALVMRTADGFMSIVALAFACLTEIAVYEEFEWLQEEELTHQAARFQSLWGLLSTPGFHVTQGDAPPKILLLNSEW